MKSMKRAYKYRKLAQNSFNSRITSSGEWIVIMLLLSITMFLESIATTLIEMRSDDGIYD